MHLARHCVSLASKYKKGGQAIVENLTSIVKGNLSKITKGAGSTEEKRRAILAVVLDLNPTFTARSYDVFLDFGQWFLNHDSDPSGWQLPVLRFDKPLLIESINFVEKVINLKVG